VMKFDLLTLPEVQHPSFRCFKVCILWIMFFHQLLGPGLDEIF
jgi:hypothetical protein